MERVQGRDGQLWANTAYMQNVYSAVCQCKEAM